MYGFSMRKKCNLINHLMDDLVDKWLIWPFTWSFVQFSCFSIDKHEVRISAALTTYVDGIRNGMADGNLSSVNSILKEPNCICLSKEPFSGLKIACLPLAAAILRFQSDFYRYLIVQQHRQHWMQWIETIASKQVQVTFHALLHFDQIRSVKCN